MEILRCIKILSCLSKKYRLYTSLRCLEYICSVSLPLRRHGPSFARALIPLNREDTDKCTNVTLTHFT